MNQILSTENRNSKYNNYKKGGPKDIRSVVKFFAIVLLIFGVFLVINSSYAMMKGEGNKKSSTTSGPTIELEKKGEDKLLLKVMHEDEIESVTYSWNDENPITVENNNTKFIQKELEIPNGKNTLYVIATDVNGNKKELEEEYELLLDINIEISISGNNIKVDVTGKEQIENLEYSWDEEEPKVVNVNDTQYSVKIQAPIGEHTLNVKATDINGVVEEKIQQVVGTTKPVVTVKKGNNAYIIKATDEIGLDRIEITTMEDGKVTKIQSDGKEFEYNFPVKEGSDNYIEIRAYNVNDVKSKKIRAKWPK